MTRKFRTEKRKRAFQLGFAAGKFEGQNADNPYNTPDLNAAWKEGFRAARQPDHKLVSTGETE